MQHPSRRPTSRIPVVADIAVRCPIQPGRTVGPLLGAFDLGQRTLWANHSTSAMRIFDDSPLTVGRRSYFSSLLVPRRA